MTYVTLIKQATCADKNKWNEGRLCSARNRSLYLAILDNESNLKFASLFHTFVPSWRESESALTYIFVGFNDENVFPYLSEDSTGFSQTVAVAATSTSVTEVVESDIAGTK